jgi:FtsZ-interacting cell division protein YlmF
VTSLAAWGPTLVMAITVLSAGAVALRFANGRRSATSSHPFISDRRSGVAAFSAALREAESVNAYRIDIPSSPDIHLKPIVRIAPANYRDGVNRIPPHFREGHVISVDLGRMNASQAARLVDFCSGYLVGVSGWLFRAADTVIMLTPTGRNVADAI